jgi:hypothetical protein
MENIQKEIIKRENIYVSFSHKREESVRAFVYAVALAFKANRVN